MQSGPKWHTVERRVTYDRHTGDVIRDEDLKGVTSHDILYAKLPSSPRDITTLLYYRPLPADDANIARATVVRSDMLDCEGKSFGALNPLCRHFDKPSLVAIPAMLRQPSYTPAHREKAGHSAWIRPALVTRNLSKKEVAAEPRAREALRKEYERLEGKRT